MATEPAHPEPVLHNRRGHNSERPVYHTHTQKDIIIINIYAINIGTPQYIGQILTTMKGEIDTNTIIVGDFNTPFTPMDRSSKQKRNKET